MNWDQFLGPAPKRPFDLERFFRWRCYWDYSGGVATDLFVHLVSWLNFATDAKMPKAIVATGENYRYKKTHEVPDTVNALLLYPEGFTANLCCTFNNAQGAESGLEILGNEGSLLLRDGDGHLHARDRARRQPLGGGLVDRGAREGVLRRSQGAGERIAVDGGGTCDDGGETWRIGRPGLVVHPHAEFLRLRPVAEEAVRGCALRPSRGRGVRAHGESVDPDEADDRVELHAKRRRYRWTPKLKLGPTYESLGRADEPVPYVARALPSVGPSFSSGITTIVVRPVTSHLTASRSRRAPLLTLNVTARTAPAAR